MLFPRDAGLVFLFFWHVPNAEILLPRPHHGMNHAWLAVEGLVTEKNTGKASGLLAGV